ncbi:phage tail protein [Streptomyces hirsutus]|uniref:phage tail protein n=1 Tax=Streptomyces hirsutus TaxID=35620 RepID=UPI003683CD4C
MLPIPSAALAALTGACRRPYFAEWSVDGGTTWTRCGVQAGSASVSADRTSDVRYSASATLTGVGLGAAGINPISTNVRLWQGIQGSRMTPVWIPAGHYTVGNPQEGRTGITVELNGLEDDVRAAAFPVARVLGPDSARAIATTLIGEALPGTPLAWRAGVDPDTMVPQIAATTDRWSVLAAGRDETGSGTGIAAALGAECFFDARGIATYAPVPTTADPPVWTLARGRGGAVIEPRAQATADSLYNLWVVSSDTGDGAATIGPVYRWDDDPTSLTFAGPDPVNDPLAPQRLGLTWVRVRTQSYTSALITDIAQAETIAASKLADSLGVRSSLALSAVCNPALEPGDVIAIEVAPGRWENHLIDSLSYTLGAAAMSLNTRTTPRRVT